MFACHPSGWREGVFGTRHTHTHKKETKLLVFAWPYHPIQVENKATGHSTKKKENINKKNTAPLPLTFYWSLPPTHGGLRWWSLRHCNSQERKCARTEWAFSNESALHLKLNLIIILKNNIPNVSQIDLTFYICFFFFSFAKLGVSKQRDCRRRSNHGLTWLRMTHQQN